MAVKLIYMDANQLNHIENELFNEYNQLNWS